MADDKEKRKEIVLHTFAKTWEFDYVIYGIGDFTLPFALSLTAAGMFIAVFFFVQIVFLILPIDISPLYRYAVLPVAITYALRKLDIDGKPPYIWLYKQALYYLQPKSLNKFRRETKFKGYSWNPMSPVVISGRKKGIHAK